MQCRYSNAVFFYLGVEAPLGSVVRLQQLMGMKKAEDFWVRAAAGKEEGYLVYPFRYQETVSAILTYEMSGIL